MDIKAQFTADFVSQSQYGGQECPEIWRILYVHAQNVRKKSHFPNVLASDLFELDKTHYVD